jgi:hypothetical protein
MTLERDAPDTDTVFDLLSNARRRHLIGLLYCADDPVPLREAAERIAAAERDVAVDEVDEPHVRSVYVSLYQTHLPRLEANEVVTYDDETGTVTLEESAATRRMFRLGGVSTPRQWRLYYVALALLAWAVIVLRAVGVVPASFVSWSVVAVVIALALVGMVAIRTVATREVDDRKLREFVD